MGLITEESKCKFEGLIEILSKREYDNIEKAYAFAETELKNLAIEFIEWKQTEVWIWNGLFKHWFHPTIKQTLTSKELFTRFIEQRKAN